MTDQVNQIKSKQDVESFLDNLTIKQNAWTAGTYAASNRELYGILASALDLLALLKSDVKLCKGFNSLLVERGIAFNNGTSLPLKIVRAVFATPGGEERVKSRLYSYARVLSAAHDAKVTGAKLIEFIEQNGGIDEIRRKGKDGAKTSDNGGTLLEYAEAHLRGPSSKVLLAGITLSQELQPADDQYYSLALVRKDADGTGSIVFGTNNKTLVSSVLAIAGKSLDSAEEEIRKKEKDDKRKVEIAHQTRLAAEELSSALAVSMVMAPSTQQQVTSSEIY